MQDHWDQFGPPVYISVASYLGLNKSGDKTARAPNGDGKSDEEKYGNLEELAAMFGDSGGVIA